MDKSTNLLEKNLAAISANDSVILWNTETSHIEQQIPLLEQGESHRILIRDMIWNSRTKSLAVICRKYWEDHQNSIVYICDFEGTNLKPVAEFDSSPLCASWSPDGTRIAIGCTYGVVQVWDKSEQKTKEFVLPVEGEAVLSACWNPSG